MGESAAIISSDEIPERRRRRRRRRCRGRHTDTRTFHFAIPTPLTPSRPRRCATHLRGAATSSAFQRRDEFCERVLHICIAPPRPSTKPFQGDYARVCANDCDTSTDDGGGGGVRGSRRERGREGLWSQPAGRPAGRSAARQQSEERRRRCALPVPYDRVYERSTSRPARSVSHVVSKLEFELAGQLSREKGEPPSRSSCASGVMSPRLILLGLSVKKSLLRAGINRFQYAAAILNAT